MLDVFTYLFLLRLTAKLITTVDVYSFDVGLLEPAYADGLGGKYLN